MIKSLLTGAAYILCGVVAGVGIWKVINKGKTSQLNYDDIRNESIKKSIALLRDDNKSEERIVGNLLIIKRIREGQVAFCLIRRYENGRTTSTVISHTFGINICPSNIQLELDSKNEVVIQKIDY